MKLYYMTILLFIISIICVALGLIIKNKKVRNNGFGIMIFIAFFWVAFFIWAMYESAEEYERHFGKEDNTYMTYELDENDNKEEKREYVKTYNVIERLDITDETGDYNYFVIKQFQDNEPVLIKVSNTYNLEKDKNYEFLLYGSKIKDKKYTQNEIFENFEIKNIVETDKTGLEQIQEL